MFSVTNDLQFSLLSLKTTNVAPSKLREWAQGLVGVIAFTSIPCSLSVSLDAAKWWCVSQTTGAVFFSLWKAEVSEQVCHGWIPFLIFLFPPEASRLLTCCLLSVLHSLQFSPLFDYGPAALQTPPCLYLCCCLNRHSTHLQDACISLFFFTFLF